MAREEDRGTVLPVGMGLTEDEHNSDLSMWSGSYNLYTDDEGYIVNYPGKSDSFYRPDDPPAYVGTPPATDVSITRVFTFRDLKGAERILFVRGADVCEKEGNGYRVIHTLIGQDERGSYFPHIFQHDHFIVIINPGDPPYIWDGENGVYPLGVRERLSPPVAWAQRAFGATGNIWDISTLWYPAESPQNPLSRNKSTDVDGTVSGIDGIYTVVVQGVDRYGNVGPCSAESDFVTIKDASAAENEDKSDFLVCEWTPPMSDTGIVGYRLGRSINIKSGDDDGGGINDRYNKHYLSYSFNGTTMHRFVHQVSDANLIDNGEIDKEIIPAPYAMVGASWSNRIFLSGFEDSNVVYWSDAGMFGQFRSINQHKCKGAVEAIIPIGDRIVFITRNSVEVMYDNGTSIVLLDEAQGLVPLVHQEQRIG